MNISNEKLHEFIEILKNIEPKECVSISIKKSKNLPLTNSKFGGLPFVPKNGEIPTNSDGQQLFHLAQINCTELPKNDLYPKTGILQFWILIDDVYGLDFDLPTSRENMRVIYIADTSNGCSEDEVRHMYQPFVYDDDFVYSPLQKENAEFSLVFEKKMKGISTSDYQFDKIFLEKWNQFFPENSIEDMYDLDDEIMEEIFDTLTSEANHQIWGYPYFTQEDPRVSEKYQKYNELLLQIDSEFDEADRGWDIIWWDCGVANFFISKENLDAQNFDDVLYNWDCS